MKIGHTFPLLVTLAIISLAHGNSVDDGPRESNKSAFPIDGTLIQMDEENFGKLLAEQLPEKITNPKTHRPLVLGVTIMAL